MMSGGKAKVSRFGYMTAVTVKGLNYGLFSTSKKELEEAFTSVTGGILPFDHSKSQRVNILKGHNKPKR